MGTECRWEGPVDGSDRNGDWRRGSHNSRPDPLQFAEIHGSIALLLLAASAAAAEPAALPRSTPEAQGVPSAAILAFVEAADKNIDALHSFMLVRHGHVVAEGWWAPYERDDPHVLLLAEQELHLHGRRARHRRGQAEPRRRGAQVLPRGRPGGAEREPEGDAGARPARDVHRATRRTTSRRSRSTTRTEPWTRAFLAQPVAVQAGHALPLQHAGDYMLSAIVQKVTGQTVLDYLRPRLFEPLGIEQPDLGREPARASRSAASA